MDEQPMMTCPQCGAELEDFDGFGVLAHTQPAYDDGCGYCTHPSRDGGVCGICGDVEDDEPPPAARIIDLMEALCAATGATKPEDR